MKGQTAAELDEFFKKKGRYGLSVDDLMYSIDNPMFFSWSDLRPLLLTGKMGFFFTSMRSVGKSTVLSALMISLFIVHELRFLYMRRTERTLEKTRKAFFDDAIDLLNGARLIKIDYFSCEAGTYWIHTASPGDAPIDNDPEEAAKRIKAEKENCGSCIHVKGYADAKSGFDKDRITTILYDEFMAEQYTEYLGAGTEKNVEWQCVMSIFMSIAREKGNPFKDDVRMFFLGNHALEYNPILIGAGVNRFVAQSPEAKQINPKNAIWLYKDIQPSEAFKQKQKESLAWEWMKYDESLQNYNFGNALRDDGTVIDSLISPDKPNGVKEYSNVILGGKVYGIYHRYRDGLMYIDGKHKCSIRSGEALDIESYNNNNAILICQGWRRSPVLSAIYERFIRKRVMFSDKQTQVKFLQYLDFVPR